MNAPPFLRSPLARYSLAVVVMLAAVALRWALIPIMGLNIPYVTVYPAMMFAAITLGAGPGVLATVLGVLLAEFYFVVPAGIEWNLAFALRASIPLLTSLYVGWVSQRLRDARARADAQAAAARTAEAALRQFNAELEQRVAGQTAALRATSLYARSLLEASLDPLVTISAEGKITDVNAATEQVTGCAARPR